MLSLRAIRERIASGQSTAQAELDRSAALIARHEPAIEAFASRPETLLPGIGPLTGIACGVKDIIDTADLPVAIQVIAGFGADDHVIAVARALEKLVETSRST